MIDQISVLLHFIWVIPLILLIAYIGSPRFKGTMGESRVQRLLQSMLQKNQYTILNNVVIPSGGGTVQIDHLVISQFRIFVIETVFLRGTISGAEFQDRWKQHRHGRFTRFDNPLHKNYLNIQALERLLQLPESRFYSIVVFAGHKGFKGTTPPHVVPVDKLIPQIRKRNEKLLSAEKASESLKTIEEARLGRGGTLIADPWTWLRLALVVLLLVAGWYAFGGALQEQIDRFEERVEMKSAPEAFHPDGRRKSEQELWEDALICAYSADSGRCACYEPDGSKVDLDPGKCKSLSERGSILKQ
jgi:hypothetical protein